MKKTVVIVTALLLLAAASLSAQSVDSAQTTCPVMGGAINKEIYTDYNGMRIYFCCAGCIETFRNDAEPYLTKMKEAGVIPEKAPVTQKNCPVTGNPVDEKVFADYNGTRIYFCCQGCVETYLKDPEIYPLNKQ
ncbi:hypothetical protein JXO52_05880 [bacterium]|nr:hypothetical protein [bacterium]